MLSREEPGDKEGAEYLVAGDAGADEELVEVFM